MRCLMFIFAFFCTVNAWSMSEAEARAIVQTGVMRLQAALEKQNPNEVAACFSYPLQLKYPLAPINDAQTFVERYGEVFDSALALAISVSDFDEDWIEAGWRGYCLGRGLVWVDFDGKVYASNHLTARAALKRSQLIEQDRVTLHPELRQYEEPVLQWETAQYHIRIDYLGDGEYRYASWKRGHAPGAKPDLVLGGGEWTPDGTGGNHYYTFVSGPYAYVCYVANLTEEAAPSGWLSVLKNDKEILSEATERAF